MSVLQYLDLSTGHVTQETCNEWAWQEIHPVIGTDEYGFVVAVPDEEYDISHVPQDLQEVIAYARKLGCSLIRFDSDGDQVEGLPFYDW